MASKRDGPAPDPKPQIILRYKERTETIDCGECDPAYAGEQVTLWINAPDRLADGALAIGAVLLQVLRGWTFQTTEGQPAPLGAEGLAALPTELVEWLYFQWQQRRHAPLAKLGFAPMPSVTPPTEALNGTPLKRP